MDPISILKVTRTIQELEGEVIRSVRLCFKVTMAEHSSRVENPGAAFSTGSRKVEAAMVAGSWFNGCGLHFLSLR